MSAGNSDGLKRWRTANAAERREAIIASVTRLTQEKGYPPLRQEVADDVVMDIKTVRIYLRQLIDEGVLEEPGGAGTRTLRLVD